MKLLFKRTLIGLGTVGSVAAPIATTVSCGGLDPERDQGYTVGLATAPVSTLNYLKYKSSVQVATSVVESLTRGAPVYASDLYTKLQVPVPHMIGLNSGGFNLSQRNLNTGTLRRSSSSLLSSNDQKREAAFWADGFSSTSAIIANINGKSEWANGDKLTSSNFIDFITYILDVNTGSQRVDQVLSLNIKYAREFVDAQKAYATRYQKTYKNPFGYEYKPVPAGASKDMIAAWTYYQQMETAFPLQLNDSEDTPAGMEERTLVAQIENAARHLGIFGDKSSSHPMNIDGFFDNMVDAPEFQVTHPKLGKVSPYLLAITPETNVNLYSYVVRTLGDMASRLMPVNRRFVESHGGVEGFGKDASTFLTEGPFTFKEIVLGQNGHIILQRNDNYHHAGEIIPESVKLFFQQDPTILGSLFEDGYISFAPINSIYAKKFFANIEKRKLIHKAAGWGATGIVFNLDKNTNKNPNLFNKHLRRAMLFATDREELIKISGFDATEPSYSLLEPTVAPGMWWGTANTITYSNFASSDRIQYTDSFSAPATSTEATAEAGLAKMASNPDQSDKLLNRDLAKEEFAKFKEETGVSHVKLNFIHDSSPAMINIAIALKSEFKQAFGDAIELDIQGLPKSIYDSYAAEGKFDITWKNLDSLPQQNPRSGGVDAFMVTDGIDKAKMKNVGFSLNPSGEWTLLDAFKDYEKEGTSEDAKARLGISNLVWNKLKELSEYPKELVGIKTADQIRTLMRQRIHAFFQLQPMAKDLIPIELKDKHWDKLDENFDTPTEIIAVTKAANRIIMDQAAFIPTFRVDVKIIINRCSQATFDSGEQMSFMYMYDLLRKPQPGLPGMETIPE